MEYFHGKRDDGDGKREWFFCISSGMYNEDVALINECNEIHVVGLYIKAAQTTIFENI
jgi:hypothetical protein